MKLLPLKRFDLRKNPNGSWTVYDIFTGQPAAVNDIVLDTLDASQAGKWVAQLNLEFAKRAGGTIHCAPQPISFLNWCAQQTSLTC